MFPQVTLKSLTREDVRRLAEWLDDSEVSAFWYGSGEDGLPLHIGYSPKQVLQVPDEEWEHTFDEEDRKIFAVFTGEGDHIGEGQLLIEWPLLEAQLFLLIGRFRHLGFVLEGHFRRTHRKDEAWYDSFAMGLLADEYARRRAHLMAVGVQ